MRASPRASARFRRATMRGELACELIHSSQWLRTSGEDRSLATTLFLVCWPFRPIRRQIAQFNLTRPVERQKEQISMKDKTILVAGGGGFIGGHLVAHFRQQGFKHIRSVDIKPLDEWYQVFDDVENVAGRSQAPRRLPGRLPRRRRSLQPRRRHGRHGLHREQQGPVHALGADQHAPAAWPRAKPASTASSTRQSACVYNADKQKQRRHRPAQGRRRLSRHARRRLRLGEALLRADVPPLPRRLRPARRAWPASTTSTARIGTWDGGREKAPAAICRKVIDAKDTGKHEIEIWGDGKQTRSFMYIDDCIEGIHKIIAQRHRRADQPRLRRAGHDQRPGRHRRGHRRHQAQAHSTTSRPPRASTAATATTR